MNHSQKEKSASPGMQRLVQFVQLFITEALSNVTLFRTYLRKEGIHKFSLAQFLGNRFNILFYDAAGVYFLHQHMIKFMKQFTVNRLIAFFKLTFIISGCRALGIIDKAVTRPLWRQLQISTASVVSGKRLL